MTSAGTRGLRVASLGIIRAGDTEPVRRARRLDLSVRSVPAVSAARR